MAINVHQFKLDNEDLLKKNLRIYFDRGRENIKKFYERDNYIYDMSTLTNQNDDKLLEVILSLYYLNLFKGISGQSSTPFQSEFPAVFPSIQTPLIQKLNDYIQARPINVFNEIYNTINSNVTKSFLKNINDQMNDEAILQFDQFQNPKMQNGLYAQKIVDSNINEQNKNREALNLGEVSAADIAEDTLNDRSEDINLNNREPVNRALALGSLILINQRLNKKEVIDGVDSDLDKNFDTIIDRLAMTETQVATETFRGEEIDSFNDELSIAGAQKDIIKTWDAILDDRVRLWHAEADGQEKPLTEPFVVNGELLNFPGDMSLGASLNNIVNCRCEAAYK